jgi:DNA-binding response OmpR family regulator
MRELEGNGATPIILLSGRDSRAQRIEGLELGADDYITKPFSPEELVSRVRGILRRQKRDRHDAPLVRGPDDMEIDYEAGTVLHGGEHIALTRSEVRLLGLLAETPGKVITRRRIMEHLWHSTYVGDERAGDIHVSNLRRKLGWESIETVRGAGYRLRV